MPDASSKEPLESIQPYAEASESNPAGFLKSIPQHQHQPKEAAFPASQGEEGKHDFGDHHERLHRMLAAVLRAGPHPALLGPNFQHLNHTL